MVRVLHARNLDGSDWAHGRGTYCVLKIQRKDQQSSLAKGTQQPSWLEVGKRISACNSTEWIELNCSHAMIIE